jgi:hypothetical protein
MKQLVLATILVGVLPFAIASADRPSPRKPPQAAFDACAKSSQGDTCTIRLGDRSIDGTCAAFRDTTTLVCRPSRPPGPPPEAIDACASANEGDACTVTIGDRAFSGTCAKGPDGNGPLACRP